MTVWVVITDDSDIAAAHISRLLLASPDIHVIGRVRTVQELMKLQARTVANVLILDMLLPEQAGISVVRTLATETAVVVVSEMASDSPLALETLARGAAAFVSKRMLSTKEGAQAFRQTVLDVASQRIKHKPGRVIAIAGSTGAVRSYETIIPPLRGSSAAIVIVQHLPIDKASLFSDWLSSFGLPTSVASAGDTLVPGHLIVAPGWKHTVVDLSGRIRLVNSTQVDSHVPSASILFSSIAQFGPRASIVILSGMGNDGASAIPAALERRSMVFVQHPAESPVPSMPQAALAVSKEVRAVTLGELSRALRSFASHGY